jgi:hypothetical protein
MICVITKLTVIHKDEFAKLLGFKNVLEAICCLGPSVFNHQFKEYINYEFKQSIKTDRGSCKASKVTNFKGKENATYADV